MILRNRLGMFSSSKGSEPHSSAYRMTPQLHTSTSGPQYSFPEITCAHRSESSQKEIRVSGTATGGHCQEHTACKSHRLLHQSISTRHVLRLSAQNTSNLVSRRPSSCTTNPPCPDYHHVLTMLVRLLDDGFAKTMLGTTVTQYSHEVVGAQCMLNCWLPV